MVPRDVARPDENERASQVAADIRCAEHCHTLKLVDINKQSSQTRIWGREGRMSSREKRLT
jgi:hypothetical protein